MKTKTFSVLLVVAFTVAACAPVIVGNESPKDPAQPTVEENAVIIPVTGGSVSIPARDAQEPRLWSGEIINSDNNSPNQGQNIRVPVNTTTEDACSSEDDLERRHGGCVE